MVFLPHARAAEPIAAAMAYGFGSPQVPYDVLLVFDLGGGTLDLTVVEAFEGIMEVRGWAQMTSFIGGVIAGRGNGRHCREG